MALINILAKSTRKVDWSNFLKDYSSLNLISIEIFPIPKQLGFGCDSIGINAHKIYTNRNIVINEIERLITFLSLHPYEFKFIELYDGVEINSVNVKEVIEKLLP